FLPEQTAFARETHTQSQIFARTDSVCERNAYSVTDFCQNRQRLREKRILSHRFLPEQTAFARETHTQSQIFARTDSVCERNAYSVTDFCQNRQRLREKRALSHRFLPEQTAFARETRT